MDISNIDRKITQKKCNNIMKAKNLNTEISVIVENYTISEIIKALKNYSESYNGDILENEPIEKLAELLIDLASATDYTATDLLDALTIGF
jgi:hypothetical protein